MQCIVCHYDCKCESMGIATCPDFNPAQNKGHVNRVDRLCTVCWKIAWDWITVKKGKEPGIYIIPPVDLDYWLQETQNK